MERITSFSVDHDKIKEGMYVSRIDGDIVTYDLRTRVPNSGDYMDNLTMHSVEHMCATFLRNSEIKDNIIYFGPMGCQTGFYLLVRGVENKKVLEVLIKALKDIVAYDKEMPGAKRKECGNYLNLDINSAKAECKRYLSVLESREVNFEYEK